MALARLVGVEAVVGAALHGIEPLAGAVEGRAAPTLRPAIWALFRAMICQPTTDVSPGSPGVYRQPPVCWFWALMM